MAKRSTPNPKKPDYIQRAAELLCDPDQPSAIAQKTQLQMARALSASGALDEAVALFELVLAADPMCKPAWMALIALTLQHRTPEAALSVCTRALTPLPDDLVLRRKKAVLLRRLNQRGKAITAFKRVLRMQPDDVSALRNLVALLLGEKRDREVASFLKRLVDRTPGDVSAWLRWVSCLQRLGQEKSALEQLDNALALHPNEPVLARLKARFLLRSGQFQEAQRLLKSVSDHGTGNRNALRIDLAHAHRRGRSFAAARVLFDEACAVHPNDRAAYLGLIQLFVDQQDFDAALAHCERTQSRLPDDPLFRRKRAMLLRKCDRAGDAVRVLEGMVDDGIDDLALQIEMGLCLRALGDTKRADACFGTVLKRSPGNKLALLQRIAIAEARGQTHEAMALLSSAG